MGLQARMSESDQRLYSPSRDVAHCFGDVMRETAARLEDERWAALATYLKEKGTSMDDLGEACRALCEFVQSAVDDKKEAMPDTLSRVGWWKVPEPAQVAACAVIGTVMLGYFWAGAHEATLGGVGPCLTYQDLRARGEEAARAIAMPRWRRWLKKWKNKVLAVFAAISGL